MPPYPKAETHSPNLASRGFDFDKVFDECKQFLSIFVPVIVVLFLALMILFECWVSFRRRAQKREATFARRIRTYEEATFPHPTLFHEIGDTHTGTRIIELNEIIPLLPADSMMDGEETSTYLPARKPS